MTNSLCFPDGLKKGDLVGVVAPSFPIKPNEFKLCESIFQKLGYGVIPGECVAKQYNYHGYLAGDAETRARDINQMFADPRIKAIFCVRGGYGSTHIIPKLDYNLIRKNPKIFVGYSDITNIHIAIQNFCKMVTFYGPMVCSNMLTNFDEYTKSSLISTINWTGNKNLNFTNPEDYEIHVFNEGRARGILTGGNLSLIARSCGSFFQLDARNKILFLEDISESIPVLDMYITQIEYANIFLGVKGILLGDFTDCNNEKYDSSFSIDDFFKERLKKYDIPILGHIRCGHDKPMGTLPLGCMCEIDAKTKQITFSK